MLNKENLKTLTDMYDQIETLGVEGADLFSFAMENKDEDIEITKDADGKSLTVKEKVLWEELRYTSKESLMTERFAKLREKYSGYFDKLFAIQDLKDSIKKYELSVLGFNFEEMTIKHLINLINAVIDLRAERE